MSTIRLTAEMRKNLSHKLTVAALKNNEDTIGKKIEALNADFWKEHCRRVEQITGTSQKTWTEAIQQGVMTSILSFHVQILDEDGKRSSGNLITIENISTGLDCVRSAYPIIDKHVFQRHNSASAIIWFISDKSLPQINDMQKIPFDSEFSIRIKEIASELETVIKAAQRFYNNSQQILLGIPNVKQLEERFPEAYALLPKQAPKSTGNLVPSGMIENVRAQLLKGLNTAA